MPGAGRGRHGGAGDAPVGVEAGAGGWSAAGAGEPTRERGPAAGLNDTLRHLPDLPGCYIFRDAAGHILYVGKALSLRNRVRSYFPAGAGTAARTSAGGGKTAALMALVAGLEFIVTDSESEALVLENNLIKQHRPKYNIRLRDDKQYPYLRLARGVPWPRLELVRQPRPDGARYFGPYPHSSGVWETMQILRRVFPYRSCSDRRLGQPHACLYHHIHRCLAPCIGACTAGAYRAMVAELEQFLDGRGEGVLTRLRGAMEAAADGLRFEEAAELRDRLRALESVLERQKVQVRSETDRDALAIARGGTEGEDAAVQVFFYRAGKLSGRDGFLLTGAAGRTDAEVVLAFLEQFYGGGGAAVPREVLLPVPLEPGAEVVVEALLRARRGGAVRLAVPRRGEKRQIVDLVQKNATEFLTAELWRRDRSAAAVSLALEDLRRCLDLPAVPRRIECYDNSNLMGLHAVAAMVVFEDGQPKKADYRKFRVKTVVGADDFATMREVLGRRFARALRERRALAAADPEGEVPAPPTGTGLPRDAAALPAADAASSFTRLPDLVVVDGGRGQLSAARAVMRELGVDDIPTCGLAKEHEWVFVEGRAAPIILPRTSPGLRLLQRARDEAHRFGLGFHRQVRGQAAVASILQEAPGIGPKRRRALLRAFGSLEALRQASVADLAAVPGMNRQAAEDVVQYLGAAPPERLVTTEGGV